MYLKNFNLCFVQVPNIYEKSVVDYLSKFGCEEDDLMKESLHPQRSCEKMGVWASRKVELFSVVQNTYERLVYLYQIFYEEDGDKRFHNFGEFIRYIYEQKISSTVDQRWYIHTLDNGDVDSDVFRPIEINDSAMEKVFVDGNGLDEFLSLVLGVEVKLDLPVLDMKASKFYTDEIKSMVDEMYMDEIEFFNFKYPK